MQLKTVEEAQKSFWNTVLEVNTADITSEEIYLVSDDNITNLLTQDRVDIRAVLCELLDSKMCAISKPHLERGDEEMIVRALINKRLEDVKAALIDTLLPGDVSK